MKRVALLLLILVSIIIYLAISQESDVAPPAPTTPSTYFHSPPPPTTPSTYCHSPQPMQDTPDEQPSNMPHILPQDFQYQVPLYDNIAVSYPQPPTPRHYPPSHRPNPPPPLQRHVRSRDHLLRYLRQVPTGPM